MQLQRQNTFEIIMLDFTCVWWVGARVDICPLLSPSLPLVPSPSFYTKDDEWSELGGRGEIALGGGGTPALSSSFLLLTE